MGISDHTRLINKGTMKITLPKIKLLFLLKHRNTPWNPDEQYASELSSGLLNSVRFITRMLEQSFRSCQPYLEQVADGNGINCVVTRVRPQVVVIEALWVTPEKLSELCQIHPDVKWIIRLHSEVPFLANEGIAMDWLNRYTQINDRVMIAANSPRATRELSLLLHHNVLHLPNCYEIENS